MGDTARVDENVEPDDEDESSDESDDEHEFSDFIDDNDDDEETFDWKVSSNLRQGAPGEYRMADVIARLEAQALAEQEYRKRMRKLHQTKAPEKAPPRKAPVPAPAPAVAPAVPALSVDRPPSAREKKSAKTPRSSGEDASVAATTRKEKDVSKSPHTSETRASRQTTARSTPSKATDGSTPRK